MEHPDKLSHKLSQILINVGDMVFRRRVMTVLGYLSLRPSDTVLDCGCGEGFYEMVISELYGCRVVGLDLDLSLVQKARNWAGSGPHQSFFVVGDARFLPFKPATFNKIICSEVLEHVENDSAVVRELWRALRRRGVLAVTVPCSNYPFCADPVNWTRSRLGLGHFGGAFCGGLWHMHCRLYSVVDIFMLVLRGKFRVSDIEGITRYCIPFYVFVLQMGKMLYTRLPVPVLVSRSMEKFEWRGVRRGNIMQWVAAGLRWIDRRNDHARDVRGAAVCVSIRATKP